MKKRNTLPLVLSLLVAGCFWISSHGAVGGEEEVDLVVNKANGIAALSLREARRIFMGDRSTWPNGKRIILLMRSPDQSERAVILRKVYNMSEADYTKYFLQAAFTGRIQMPPKNIGSAAQMKQVLAADPRTIGYLKKDDIDDTVKVVLALR